MISWPGFVTATKHAIILAMLAASSGTGFAAEKTKAAPKRADAVTFNRDVAPIIFGKCVECHHPGGSSPFSLTTFADVKKRGKLITRITASRLMPPWMPERGHGKFVGERWLSDDEIATIARWWDAGMPEGPASQLVAKATWNPDWKLGKPDLVITLPEPYALRADGPDVYRNFVIPNIVPSDRYLRASEFRPGTSGAIHHAFVLLDDRGGARKRDAQDPEPGFAGMDAGGAGAPASMFIGWQPGKRPSEAPEGMATLLRPTTDAVLQLHMRPTGKPEKVQPSVALYFTDQAPSRSPVMLLLRSLDLDIPAGAKDYAFERSYELPVDVEISAILPHLHFLGKEVQAWAELPDGKRRELLLIKKWDFNWQGDYRFAEPERLPKGTVLRMRYTYDNSEANPENPNHPPRRVTYGPQSSDEMGELWIQMLPQNLAEDATLRADIRKNVAVPDSIAFNTAMLRRDPKDTVRRAELGAALAASGRLAEAEKELNQSVAENPKLARAFHLLGQIGMQQEDSAKAKAALKRAVELEPKNAIFRSEYGWVLFASGETAAGISELERAVILDSDDMIARRNLQRARAATDGR